MRGSLRREYLLIGTVSLSIKLHFSCLVYVVHGAIRIMQVFTSVIRIGLLCSINKVAIGGGIGSHGSLINKGGTRPIILVGGTVQGNLLFSNVREFGRGRDISVLHFTLSHLICLIAFVSTSLVLCHHVAAQGMGCLEKIHLRGILRIWSKLLM